MTQEVSRRKCKNALGQMLMIETALAKKKKNTVRVV